MDTDEKRSSAEEENDSSEDDTSESEPELMVTSRARRVTAGNRYSTLVAQEEAAEAAEQDEEDEVAMLFAEGEGEDDDFNSDEGDEDADMSSSDDDDQGPNVAAEDMEGEKEIQKEAKAERSKKRKADLALTTIAGIRKKPKIDPTALRRAPVPKPSKRKERVSWLPGSDAAPGRSSLRKQTILHRAETHAKLIENEEQRLKMKARREKREREREAEAPKEMTQADRLAEAERVERRNAKSLNRWEAMEKKRAEEQAARLAALKERKLEGAVVTWYSSSAKYSGLKGNKDADVETPPEGKKRGRKPKALLEQLAAAKLASSQQPMLAPAQSQANKDEDGLPPPVRIHDLADTAPEILPNSVDKSTSGDTPTKIADRTVPPKKIDVIQADQKGLGNAGDGFLTGIHEYASMPSKAEDDMARPNGVTKDSNTSKASSPQATSADNIVPTSGDVQDNRPHKDSPVQAANGQDAGDVLVQNAAHTTDQVVTISTPSECPSVHPPSSTSNLSILDVNKAFPLERVPTESDKIKQTPSQLKEEPVVIHTYTESTHSQTSPMVVELEATSPARTISEPPIEVISTRNLIILDKFDNISDQARQDFGLFYNNRKTAKPVKHSQELCPLTGLTARYRDPATGIAYGSAKAYQKLQELKKHEFAWSSMLGCYVGRVKTVARGVPDGFLAT